MKDKLSRKRKKIPNLEIEDTEDAIDDNRKKLLKLQIKNKKKLEKLKNQQCEPSDDGSSMVVRLDLSQMKEDIPKTSIDLCDEDSDDEYIPPRGKQIIPQHHSYENGDTALSIRRGTFLTLSTGLGSKSSKDKSKQSTDVRRRSNSRSEPTKKTGFSSVHNINHTSIASRGHKGNSRQGFTQQSSKGRGKKRKTHNHD